MAALPPINRITKEDLRDAPSWVDRLLYPLNLFMNAIYSAMNKGLTLEENALCQIQTFSITAGASASDNTVKFLLTMRRKPQYLLPLTASENGASAITTGSSLAFDWNYDGVNVNITSITGLSAGTAYNFAVLLF